jgi:hypothetical protein
MIRPTDRPCPHRGVSSFAPRLHYAALRYAAEQYASISASVNLGRRPTYTGRICPDATSRRTVLELTPSIAAQTVHTADRPPDLPMPF